MADNRQSSNPEPQSDRGDERLRALATTTLAILWTADSDGAISSDNPSWAAFTGQSHAQYRQHGWLDAVHPADRPRVAARWLQAVADGQRMAMSYRLRRHDGVYREVSAEGAPVLCDGRVVEWVGFCIDVTDARRAEDALIRSASKLRFLDSIGDATRHLVDATEVMAVTARLLGQHLGATRTAYADVEADGDRFHIRADWSVPGVASSTGSYSLAMFGPEAVANLHRGVDLVVRDVDRELGDDGGARMFNAIGIKAVICAGLVKQGRLVAMMAVHQSQPRDWTETDIDIVDEVVDRCWAHIERVRDTAKLQEQDRRKDEFLAVLGHELRNPLAPLRYAGAILRHAPAAGQASKGAIDIIERQVGHMARLIDDLLDLSRINRGLIHLRPEPAGLRALLQQAADMARPQIDAARHRLELRLPADDIDVLADPARLVQVVGNLLHNAAKYTPDGGHITLGARRTGDHAVIDVADNGIGFPNDQQGRLFQMFSQLQHSAGRAQGGLGIGLALVKTLVELHGGRVQAYSPGLNQGSTFTVEVPLAPEAVRVANPGAAPADASDGTAAGLRVLVVEDNADGRSALVELLQLLGFAVTAASDGQSGLAAAASFRPHAVLLDLGLPDIDGVEVARRLRADPAHAAVKIIALTGRGLAADRLGTSAAGFDDHLVKPVDPELLRATLTRLATQPS